jgi:hypothetical protein
MGLLKVDSFIFKTLICRSNGSMNYTVRSDVRLFVSLELGHSGGTLICFLSANKKPNYYVSEEGGVGEVECSETPSLLLYTLRYTTTQ